MRHPARGGPWRADIAFTPSLRLKDVEYALRLARHFGVGTPFGALAASLYRQLCEVGLADANESCIIDLARRQ